MEPRKCSRCKEVKDDFYNDKSFYCKSCASEFSKERRAKIKSGEVTPINKNTRSLKWKAKLKEEKKWYCNDCEKVKDENEFALANQKINRRKSCCRKCEKWKLIKKEKEIEENRIKNIHTSEWYKKHIKKRKKRNRGELNSTSTFKKLKQEKIKTFLKYNG